MSTNSKYWEYYSPSGLPKFANQGLLNYQLNIRTPKVRLESDEINPLTVRLLITHEAITHLNDYLQDRTDLVRAAEANRRRQFQQFHQMSTTPTGQIVIDPYWTPSGSALISWQSSLQIPKQSYPNFAYAPPDFTDAGQDWKAQLAVEFHPIKVHIAVYSFFTNLASALDRLSHEVILLYPARKSIDNWSWGKLFSEPYKSDIRGRDSLLGTIIDKYRNTLVASHTSDYRHVITHQGYLPIKVEFNNASHTWETKLPRDPDDPHSPLIVDALPFMRQQMWNLLTFLDELYGHLLAKLSSSIPPW